MKHIKLILIFIVVFGISVYLGIKFFWKIPTNIPFGLSGKVWPTQSIDTVKYSRDLAREKLNDLLFDSEIEKQVSDIASTGATHIAIGTPYDEEFYKYLVRWVNSARKHNLHVWFRGNLSGWEGWFEYKNISREEHTEGVLLFVNNHPEIFEDGDIFTSCPECENGGPGDPRLTGDIIGFRKFLINENNQLVTAFKKINKKVVSGYYSMNGDVAKLVMDRDTTAALGGVATIDHYVSSPDKLIQFINELAYSSGGKVVLGEWGAPIPDINGAMSEKEQSSWIYEALSKLALNKKVVGINYWTNKGSSTALWGVDGTEYQAVSVLKGFYTPQVVSGVVENEVGNAIYKATIKSKYATAITDYSGRFKIELLPDDSSLSITANGYSPQSVELSHVSELNITLIKVSENYLFRFAKWLHLNSPL